MPPAVAKAAMETGVARRPIADMRRLRGAALGPARSDRRHAAAASSSGCARSPKRVVFAEGEEEQVDPRRRSPSHNAGLGTPILVGREEPIARDAATRRHRPRRDGIEIHNARLVARATATTPTSSTSACSARATCSATASAWSTRTATSSRACMVALGDADAHGDRRHPQLLDGATTTCAACIDAKPGHRVIGVSIVLARGRTVFVADTAVHEMPDARGARRHRRSRPRGVARRLGYEPRVALLAYSTFGQPRGRARRAGARGGAHPRQPRRSTSSTTARWRPTWRSTAS